MPRIIEVDRYRNRMVPLQPLLVDVLVQTEKGAVVRGDPYQHALVLDARGEVIANFRMGERTLYLHQTMPETILQVLPGRRLRDLIDLDGLVGASDAKIRSAKMEDGTLTVVLRGRARLSPVA